MAWKCWSNTSSIKLVLQKNLPKDQILRIVTWFIFESQVNYLNYFRRIYRIGPWGLFSIMLSLLNIRFVSSRFEKIQCLSFFVSQVRQKLYWHSRTRGRQSDRVNQSFCPASFFRRLIQQLTWSSWPTAEWLERLKSTKIQPRQTKFINYLS